MALRNFELDKTITIRELQEWTEEIAGVVSEAISEGVLALPSVTSDNSRKVEREVETQFKNLFADEIELLAQRAK